MPIPRTLAVLFVLFVAVAAWLVASAPPPDLLRVDAAQMAPATIAPGQLPSHPPTDLDWRPMDQHVLADWHSPYWLRWQLPAEPADDTDRALRLSLRAASQLYWNGHPWTHNGVVAANAAEEQPGLIDIVRRLPPSAGKNPDELVVLASSQRQRFHLHSADATLLLGSAQTFYGRILHPWLIAAFATGGLVAACLYFLAVQRGRPGIPGGRLLLGLGTVGVLLPLAEAWRPLIGYTYPWQGPRLVILLALHVAAAALLPAYLARRFGLTVRTGVGIGYLAALLASATLLSGFDARSTVVLLLSLLASAYLLLRAQGEADERWPVLALILAGTVALLIANSAFLDGPYFLLLAVLMGFLLLRHAAQLNALDEHNALLREERSRLSLQLLQRGIQPHWLMNTLTCLQELIEQSPPRASRLVESLAGQFDQLRESSQHPLVSLHDELALCRNHLDIVSQALDRPILLQVEGGDVPLSLPPGVLHAQIENALTHAGALACAQHPFQLRIDRQAQLCTIDLRSACGSGVHRGHGTGTRYIEASLAAAYPAGWRFSQGADGGHWHGRIEFTCAC